MTAGVIRRAKRIQRCRTKGWRMPEGAIYVGRPTVWGNPYRVGEACDKRQIARWGWKFKNPDFVCPDAATALRLFSACLALDQSIHEVLRDHLGGHDLVCWCRLDAPCHADFLLEIANP